MLQLMPENPNGVVIVLVDVQDRLVKAMTDFEPVKGAITRALRVAGLLGLPVVTTEQYPQGLGATLPELLELVPAPRRLFSKTTFSCWGSAEFAAALDASRPQTLVLCGMETHVCVQQTALGALKRGYQVLLLADAVCARKPLEHRLGIELMQHAGATVTTVESIAFHLLTDAAHPRFKEVAKLFKG